MKKFYNGQPVICTDDDFKNTLKHYARFSPNLPVKGRHYIVRCYIVGGNCPEGIENRPCIVLREISNIEVPYTDGVWREMGFWDRRFEPVTDISRLEKLQKSKRLTVRKDSKEQVRKRKQKEDAE